MQTYRFIGGVLHGSCISVPGGTIRYVASARSAQAPALDRRWSVDTALDRLVYDLCVFYSPDTGRHHQAMIWTGLTPEQALEHYHELIFQDCK